MMLLNKAQGLINAIIEKFDGISKPRQKFIQHILILYMGLRGKYNFMNMARYGSFNEKTYRNQMEQPFDWAGFNVELVRSHCSKELILAYDPSYLPKSGKKTPDVGNFYSETAQRVKRGIEIGCMAIIDVENGTGFSLEAVQTPVTPKGQDREESSVTHHLKVVKGRPKLYEGKVNTRYIDCRRIRFCFAIDEDTHVFSSLV